MELSDALVKSFAIGCVQKESAATINSLDYHRTEDILVTAADDDAIRTYNTQTASSDKVLYSKKYGVANICFTHHANSVVYSSTKGTDHALRYLSLHDNRYLRYFRGHAGRVTTVALSPKSDLFLSAAADRALRLWDLRSNMCQGVLHAPVHPCGAFDQQGLVFAAGADSGQAKLYDVRTYSKGPFATFVVYEELANPLPFAHLRFSCDGKLLAAAVEGRLYQLDAFSGDVQFVHSTGVLAGGRAMEPTFSPDSRYLLSGCDDRAIRVWSTATGEEVAVWAGHTGHPACLKWAPRRVLVASACTNLALWVPSPAHLQGTGLL